MERERHMIFRSHYSQLPIMLIRITPALRVLLAVLALTLTAPVLAADPVTDAMQQAYPAYRAALFKTNSGSQAESQKAMSQAQAAWQQLASQFGTRPPAPYDRDKAFAASVTKVASIYVKAAGEIGNNQLAQAHETLEEARDVMAEMRRRNNVVVYSDHMNAYHMQMEHVLNEGVKWLDQPQGMLKLTAEAGVLAFLLQRIDTEAPADYAQKPEFKSLLNAVQQSVTRLSTAVMAQDAAAVKAAIGKLKSPYGKLFLNFG